ncbi:carboxymuconolactone decarboxylase family protein [Rhodoplanes sp. TEM]|uniref:Carboxymuconolactone decarboxylase family protein n=1 Tax=Rhodoplanes tepidamans TaxID=200616 RepID=A0ABT5JD03_RHOTP|nr:MULTISPECIES: carboxymuconolactone decarboxylase family protein [Rhodoplanes]MDC7787236.1 carboxymuconolactone decarboxylase family protein [Rhodoplanes tepidamans]MDC7986581.1 carboxymuconolactone decarboxylase family protein [Rhodoplanes sp. TEM]MDQ0357770.1 4-carboxymuconolactone decarboxylase [Rhodoplanes tepidamans]
MRIPDLSRDEMDEAQRCVADEAVAGKRGRVPAPLRAWLHSPEMGARAQRLGEFCRYDTILGARYSELAILVVARTWTAHFEWYAHKRDGLAAGLDPAVVAAIAARETPEFGDDAKARAVYDYTSTLLRTHHVPDAVHARAEALLGVRGVVELVGLVGYYTLVAMTLNAFAIGLPDGVQPELDP